jgi:hypothetical protein
MACGLLPGGRHARPHPEELRDLPEHEGILHLGRQALSCGGSDRPFPCEIAKLL